MLKKIQETTAFIKARIKATPEIGIILGTGLGGLINEIEDQLAIPYKDIPNFPVSTVEGHAGQLIFGKLGGRNIVAMQGRFHYYEGYTMREVTFPIRIMKMLGIRLLMLSNASGGLNPAFEVGDLMVITDHINLMPSNPLTGENFEELGPRFPDMSEAYDKETIRKALQTAAENKLQLRTGIYAGVSGPTFETPAEYNFIRIIGADAVGMSTVPEVMVARHMGLTCFAVSVISDLGVQGKIEKITHKEVINSAALAEPRMTLLISELIKVV